MAAIHEVRGLLAGKVATLNFRALVDQDGDTPAELSDCPAVIIQEDGAQIERLEGHSGGTMTHRGTFLLTCCARAQGNATAREAAYAIMSAVINALLADYTLGDKVQEILPISYGGEVPQGNDVEGIGLDLEIVFCTSNTDFDTLI